MRRYTVITIPTIFLIPVLQNGQAQAQDWQPYFNESQGENREYLCVNGMAGMRVKGEWNYLISLLCRPTNSAGLTVDSGQMFSPPISENRANTYYTCPRGEVAVGMKCSGQWCDDVLLACARVDPSRVELTDNCGWTGNLDKQGDEENIDLLNYITGVSCAGGWCYAKSLRHCEGRPVQPSEVVTDSTGAWQLGCAGADCELTVEESFDAAQEVEKVLTREVRSHVSTTVDTSFQVLGNQFGVEVTAGVEAARENTKKILNSFKVGQSRSCKVTVDLTNDKAFAAWQWTYSAKINGHPITARTCNIACTPDLSPPQYLPGAPEHLDSCNEDI